MTSLGCLMALTGVVAPRLILLLAWAFADRWVLVWGGDIVAAVLGIVFLPYATIMYVTVWVPEGVVGFAWALLLFGLLLDLMSWGNVLIYRRAATAYVARYYTPSAQPIRQGDSGSTDAGDGPGAQG